MCQVESNQNLRVIIQVRPSEILNSAMLFVASSFNFLLCAEVHVLLIMLLRGFDVHSSFKSNLCF